MTTLYRKQQGFSLIELMVSLSVFAIVMLASTAALLAIIDANAKAQALYSAMTNLSFAVDSMSRNIRMGYNFNCGTAAGNSLPNNNGDCINGAGAITFTTEKDDKRIGYRINSSRIEQRVEYDADGNGTRESEIDWLPVTAPTLNISTFRVVLVGSQGGNGVQPEISFLIKGSLSNGLDAETSFAIQTQVTERILNY